MSNRRGKLKSTYNIYENRELVYPIFFVRIIWVPLLMQRKIYNLPAQWNTAISFQERPQFLDQFLDHKRHLHLHQLCIPSLYHLTRSSEQLLLFPICHHCQQISLAWLKDLSHNI